MISIELSALRRAWLLAITLSLPALAQKSLTLDQIVERHVEALGGAEKIHALKTLIIRGMHHEGGAIPPGTPIQARNYMAFVAPCYGAIGDPAVTNPALREGFDGSAWEYYGDPGVALRTVGASAAALRHTFEFLQDSLVDAAEKGTRLTLEGTERLGDRDCYKIQVTLADGFQKFLFVDQKTFLIDTDRKSAPIHAFGKPVTSETRLSDYRPVNGVLMWRRSLETEISTGKVLAEGRRVTIEANPVVKPAMISPPQRTPSEVQQFLEQLYYERTDPISVGYTYRIFRHTHLGIDTRSGVEFIGFQMLKMGDYPGAIELLKANAADYPSAASAHFGLGRAYKSAGDAESARRAFEKALQIDPTFKSAREGLEAMR